MFRLGEGGIEREREEDERTVKSRWSNAIMQGGGPSENDQIYTIDIGTSKVWPEGNMASYQRTSL